MRKITFSVDETLIERARATAQSQGTTLNTAFRDWLEQFAGASGSVKGFDALMGRLRHVNSGRSFSRDEMNKR